MENPVEIMEFPAVAPNRVFASISNDFMLWVDYTLFVSCKVGYFVKYLQNYLWPEVYV